MRPSKSLYRCYDKAQQLLQEAGIESHVNDLYFLCCYKDERHSVFLIVNQIGNRAVENSNWTINTTYRNETLFRTHVHNTIDAVNTVRREVNRLTQIKKNSSHCF